MLKWESGVSDVNGIGRESWRTVCEATQSDFSEGLLAYPRRNNRENLLSDVLGLSNAKRDRLSNGD